ncbi:MAG: DUF3604 domain-containing protein [Bryobacterales bacterium]|nr:DUF3604 domain-containing protein [Bryobacterales bacterium]
MTRREWMMAAMAALAKGQGRETEFKVFFGDLHNHNVIGYAQGSLRRSFEIARNHLDFFAFTPHAHWGDIEHYEQSIEDKWINGFAVTRARWGEVVRMVKEFDAPGKFVPIPGYEWHSTHSGDYNIVFPELDVELHTPDDLRELQSYVRRKRGVMIPHHPANRVGHRGADFSKRDPALSPVLEMYSEWGSAEYDRGPYPYIRHTEGGRWTKNTMQYLLAQGHRFGVVASTDDHLGYPGAYGEGLAAVLAPELSREAIFDALRNRRTYAVTGDRILLDVRLNGRVMGQELPDSHERVIEVAVEGWDQIDRVEVLKNNRVIHRDFPCDRRPGPERWNQPLLARFEYGWGPWPALGWSRTADWEFDILIDNGRIENVETCFLSGPLDESRRDRIVDRTERSVRVVSFTSLKQQLEDRSQKAVVLKFRGTPESKIRIELRKPSRQALSLTLRELAESSEMLYSGPFPKENAMLQRLVFADHFETRIRVEDVGEGAPADWYYTRVVQANGQLAWSSPIWVNGRA